MRTVFYLTILFQAHSLHKGSCINVCPAALRYGIVIQSIFHKYSSKKCTSRRYSICAMSSPVTCADAQSRLR